MAKPSGLEELRALFQDPRVWIGLGQVKEVETSPDRSTMRALVQLFPDLREIVAVVTWENVGPNAGIMGPPVAGDLVLLAYVGDEDHAFVIRRLSSKVDSIPEEVAQGHTVVKAITGKNVLIAGQNLNLSAVGPATMNGSKVNLGAGSEALVLGEQLKTMLGQLIDALSEHTHTGPYTGPSAPPGNASAFTALKSQNILSTKSFTE